MRHSFKTNYGQCHCRWCGMSRHGADDCPVTAEMRDWLYQFALDFGRRWKSKLRSLWNSGSDDGIARRIRNLVGPNKIDKITTALLKREHDQAETQTALNNSSAKAGV
jgi:hypothetical protein